MDPSGELAQFDQCRLEFVGGGLESRDDLRVGVRSEAGARDPQGEGRRDQALLRAVV